MISLGRGVERTGATRSLRTTVEPVLGTRLDLQVEVDTGSGRRARGLFGHRRSEALRAELVDVVASEADRLALVFSVYDLSSELRLWRETAVVGSRQRLSVELVGLLRESARWQQFSNGAYNPAVGTVFDRWRHAESTGIVPSLADTDTWARELDGVAYEIEGDEVVCLKDCTGLTFNSFAKGVIADRAADSLFAWAGIHGERVVGAVVNLGGDIALRSFPIRVGIEDPARPFENEPPLCVLGVADGGVATSGSSRRPLVIDGARFSHLIDPRTCRPVENGPASVTVLAASAGEADVLATIVAVTGEVPPDRPGQGVAFVGVDGAITVTDSLRALIMP